MHWNGLNETALTSEMLILIDKENINVAKEKRKYNCYMMKLVKSWHFRNFYQKGNLNIVFLEIYQ